MKLAVGAVAVILVILVGGGGFVAYNSSERQTSFTVESKERVCSADDCKYLIFTNEGTFENTDTVFKGKFNSSDIYGDFKEGQTYDVTVWGWRVPFLSMYPNIIKVN